MSLRGLVVSVGAALLALGATACMKEEVAAKERLDRLIGRVDALEKAVDKIQPGAGGPAGPAPRRPGAPDPSAVYAVPIDGDPVHGSSAALVTVVQAAEFACPYCRRAAATMEELQKVYGGKVRLVWKNYVVHPNTATIPALAACAAGEQGKFFEFEKLIWEKGWPDNRPSALGEDTMTAIAQQLQLNLDKFKSDMNGDKCKQDLAADQRILAAVGTRGTPAFYINGRYISGAQPLETFKAVVDEELAKAEAAVKRGVRVEDYYAKVVVQQGKKSVQ